MKCLPLWQPWASLMAAGVKSFETRSWHPPRGVVGSRIALHATKTRSELWRAQLRPFTSYLPDPATLPLGAIIATMVIDHVVKITPEWAARLERDDPDEYAFGDYTPGRYAWHAKWVEPLPQPLPYRGSQGVFEVPSDVLAAAGAHLDVGADRHRLPSPTNQGGE